MNNPEKLVTLGTPGTGRSHAKYKNTTQHRKLKTGVNPGACEG